jgi:hypothetical protein
MTFFLTNTPLPPAWKLAEIKFQKRKLRCPCHYVCNGRDTGACFGKMRGSESSTSSVPAQTSFRSSKWACPPRCMLTFYSCKRLHATLSTVANIEPSSSSVCCVDILTYWDSSEVLAQSNSNGMPPCSSRFHLVFGNLYWPWKILTIPQSNSLRPRQSREVIISKFHKDLRKWLGFFPTVVFSPQLVWVRFLRAWGWKKKARK